MTKFRYLNRSLLIELMIELYEPRDAALKLEAVMQQDPDIFYPVIGATHVSEGLYNCVVVSRADDGVVEPIEIPMTQNILDKLPEREV